MKWYLIQTKSNAYSIATNNLRRQGFEVFQPLIIKTSREAKKFVTSTIPLFPSYLFLGSNFEQIPWKSINATRGVSKIVTLDGNYRPISEQIINSLKFRCDSNNVLKMKKSVRVGDRMKIENGPFSEFICEVENIDANQRVWVLIELLQQKTRTQVSIRDLAQTY